MGQSLTSSTPSNPSRAAKLATSQMGKFFLYLREPDWKPFRPTAVFQPGRDDMLCAEVLSGAVDRPRAAAADPTIEKNERRECVREQLVFMISSYCLRPRRS